MDGVLCSLVLESPVLHYCDFSGEVVGAVNVRGRGRWGDKGQSVDPGLAVAW
jgi:hypothetical protein